MATSTRARSYLAPIALLFILIGLAGAMAAMLRWQTWLIRSMNDYGGLAAWVQAVMSVAAIAAGFVVLLVQNALEHRAEQRDCRDQVCLMAGVAQSCAEDFAEWIALLTPATGPLGRSMGQPHLFLAVEGLMFRDVGNVKANRLMIELRRIVQDAWWQIETADEVLRDKLPKEYYPDCLAELRRLHVRTCAIEADLSSFGRG